MKICDLHCHSNFSDGSLNPSELIALAERQGLSALALTDHNTTKGLRQFARAAKESVVETAPGCEFSTEFEGEEIHVVGLFLPETKWEEVEDFVEEIHKEKFLSNLRMLKKLNAAGYEITYEEVDALTDADVFNRNPVARILVQKGYVGSIGEAFETLLKEGNGFYTEPKRLATEDTIRFIKSIGGVAVWAHPLFYMPDTARVAKALPTFKKAGLDALETIYTTYSERQFAEAKALADAFGLLSSGGSDFHGDGKPDISLGTGRGNLAIPYAFFESLQQRAR